MAIAGGIILALTAMAIGFLIGFAIEKKGGL
jgi:hypothetical protein